MFRALEFRTLTNMLVEHVGDDLDVVVESSSEPPTETIIVHTKAQLDELVAALNKAEMISFDLETTSLNKMEADIVGICLAVEPPTGYYIPVGHLAAEAQATSGQMGLFAAEAQLAEGSASPANGTRRHPSCHDQSRHP